MNATNPFDNAPIIFQYTHAQAIDEGVDRLTFRVLFLQSGGRHVTAMFKAVRGPGAEGLATVPASEEIDTLLVPA